MSGVRVPLRPPVLAGPLRVRLTATGEVVWALHALLLLPPAAVRTPRRLRIVMRSPRRRPGSRAVRSCPPQLAVGSTACLESSRSPGACPVRPRRSARCARLRRSVLFGGVPGLRFVGVFLPGRGEHLHREPGADRDGCDQADRADQGADGLDRDDLAGADADDPGAANARSAGRRSRCRRRDGGRAPGSGRNPREPERARVRDPPQVSRVFSF